MRLRNGIGYLLHGVSGLLIAQFLFMPVATHAQEEAASAFLRYKDREASTGFYEQYEVLPRKTRPIIAVPGVGPGVFAYSPSAAQVRTRTRLADSHRGIKFYNVLRCEYCHVEQTKDIHTVRARLTCRQCHGGEPIAGIEYYYSPMNPVRRHAYVCAKCHEGSSASFASYVVHSPNPTQVGTLKTFPVLFYVFWFMVVLAGGTFLVFLPHTALWGIREFMMTKKKTKKDGKARGEQNSN
jgi:succinate dehydrogenase/fumarate reductase cytochrome b subunit